MQTGAKKFITLSTVAFVAAGAYLSARLFSQYVAGKLETGEAAETRVLAEGIRPQAASRLADYDAITERNLFNANPSPPGSMTAADTQPAAEPPKPEPPKLGAILVATAARTEGASFAIFQEGSTSNVVTVGEQVAPGVSLQEVGKDYVMVSIGGNIQKIELFAPRPATAGAAAEGAARGPATVRQPRTRLTPGSTPPEGAAAQPPSSETIRQISENSWVIDRREVDEAVANMTNLMTQIRVVPNVSGDGTQTDGFKVFSIRPASLFTRIGIQNGDIIKEVNGISLSGIEQAYEAFSKLQGESSIQVNLLRRGQPVTLAYDIR